MNRFLRELREYLGALTVAFLVVTFGFTTVGVAGSSMEPTLEGGLGRLPESLLTGDRLFVPKYETWLRRLGVMGTYVRGDIVIAREPAGSPVRRGRRDFVFKRVIGVPGDTVEGRSGQLFVNGERLDQSFITAAGVSLGNTTFAPLTPAENAFFIMGYNRTRSADSRLYGPVPFLSIAGRATAVVWPPVRGGGANGRLLHRPAAFAALTP
jgi:signal peptidase I